MTNPRYSYAGGKIISELLALNFLRKTDTQCVIFRPHNFIGPDMGFEHVIPELMRKIFRASDGLTHKQIDLEIQGTGEETRAFCYVDNGVDGTILCGEKGADGAIYHIGEMREISILKLVRMMGDGLGLRINVVPGPLQAGGTPRRCPDTTKLGTLGYVPRVGLEEGLERTMAWYVDYFPHPRRLEEYPMENIPVANVVTRRGRCPGRLRGSQVRVVEQGQEGRRLRGGLHHSRGRPRQLWP